MSGEGHRAVDPQHPAPTLDPPKIQMKDVVTMARMVPVGMDFWASLRSPDRLEPAMMPTETEGELMGHRD